MTSIDTIYEYAGYKFAGTLSLLFSSVGLPLILALAGVAHAVYSIADRGSVQRLGVHVLYLILAAWLLGSTKQQGITTPRFVAYLGQAADVIQKRAVKQINEKFLTDPFEFEQIAARVSFGRILDPALEKDVGEFLASCGRTTAARAEPRHGNLLRDGALPYEGACEQRRRELWQRLQAHVQNEPHHRATTEAARKKDPAQATAFRDRYADEIAIRAIDEPGSPTSETSLVVASLGNYSYTDPAQHTGALPPWVRATMGVGGWLLGDEIANVALTGLSELQQNYENRIGSKQKYYQATVYGPHLYGLSLMILLGLFPIAALFALLPGHWKVFVNYGKVLFAVKLWPVGWALLSSFNQRRGALEAFDPPERTGGTAFLGIAAMYLLIPAISFAIVHLATSVAALPFAPAVPPPAGPGLGPLGPVLNVAARLAK
jgi:hypothetical protein